MKLHLLKRKIIIGKNIEEVFGFFSKAENLNRLTPPALNFKITTGLPLEMKKGAIIDYQLRLNGINFKWRTEITKWEPPHIFEDKQIKGPYKVWIHEHKFEAINNSTHMTDTVKFLSPGGVFEPVLHNFFVKRKVKSIFDYREKILLQKFS